MLLALNKNLQQGEAATTTTTIRTRISQVEGLKCAIFVAICLRLLLLLLMLLPGHTIFLQLFFPTFFV